MAKIDKKITKGLANEMTKNMTDQEKQTELAYASNAMFNQVIKLYTNKNSDEYKSSGDIKKTRNYDTLKVLIEDLPRIKKLDAKTRNLLNDVFDSLHKPIFKKMVTEFIAEPNERNIVYTSIYTLCYRALVSELSRVYFNTTATETGFEYSEDVKSEVVDDVTLYMFNKVKSKDFEKWVDSLIDQARTNKAFNPVTTEYFSYVTEYELYDVDLDDEERYIQEAGPVDTFAKFIADGINAFINMTKKAIHNIKEFNPISFINTLLTRSYDKKVKSFLEAAEMYKATKKAYEDYMSRPATERKGSVEKKYMKNMNAYNVKMRDLYAEIKHYDARGLEEAKKEIERSKEQKEQSMQSTSSNTSADDIMIIGDDNDDDYGF